MNIAYIAGIAVLLWISANVYRRRKRRNKVVCVVESNCTGCRQCVKRCSRHVLEMEKDETGSHVVVKYPGKCTACGHCLEKCKFNALNLIERI
ncbi:MAG: 4Fe-4S dicluster domain-containing protein [Tannerellaceae bacterium]|jgi:NAD-dependent dihydropyrimidine dehydrogenase PreA subunit|nr:4Fe-4S dicluster domain-containing protein [Tannerellaceae bacterium]